MHPPITPPTDTKAASFHSIDDLNRYIAADKIDNGSIIAIAHACALCSSTSRYFSIHGTAIVPPPEPNKPFAKPVIKPIEIVFILFFKISSPIYIFSYNILNIHSSAKKLFMQQA